MDIAEAVDHIRLLPGAFVDSSFGQGRDVFLKQLEKRTGRDESTSVDVYIQGSRSTIAKLVERAKPYSVPNDYLFFLEFYGGLAIDKNDDYYLSVLGTGPRVEDWYASVESDKALQEPGRHGFLSLGSLSFGQGHKHRFKRVTFFIDLAGTVKRHCVIGVGPWGQGTPRPFEILRDRNAHPDSWRRIADSFSEWLEEAAKTPDAFGYS